MTESATDKVPRERSAAYEARRTEILSKVALAFGKDGYHRTSVSSLADRIGVSKPVLYYYAKNKDDLLFQCVLVGQRALDEVVERSRRMQVSSIGKLRFFFSAYAEIMSGDIGRFMVLVDHRDLGEEARRENTAARRTTEEFVCGMIREGKSDGTIGACDPAIVARAMFGAFNAIPRWFRQDGELSARDVADAYLDLFLTGLGRAKA